MKTHKDSHHGKLFTAANPQRISLKPTSENTPRLCKNKGFGFVVLVNPVVLPVPCVYLLHPTLRKDCCCGKEKVEMLLGG